MGFMMLRSAFALALLGVAPVVVQAQSLPDTSSQIPLPPPRAVEIPEGLAIPDDIDIWMIREELIPGQFRILEIGLNRSVSEATLTVMANMLRDADVIDYERTYIVYYLPGMQRGDAGWATSHFNPDLEVVILDPTM